MIPQCLVKSFTFMGIHFAPIYISIRRRMETLSILVTFLLLVSPVLSYAAVLWFLFRSSYWYIMIPYYIWIYLDRDAAHTGGRKIRWMQSLAIWRLAADYFPLKLVKTEDLPPTKNYLFAVYPHGVMSISSFLTFSTDALNFDSLYPDIDRYRITLDSNFCTPFTRWFYLATGHCASSARSILNLLSREKSTACVLIVGGASESYNAYPGTYKIILNRRRGFVRLAMQTGASLVPVISFGENDLFNQFTSKYLRNIQNYFQSLTGIAPIFVRGRGVFQYSVGFVPYRHKVTTVVGKPIDLPKIENPSNELVEQYRLQFANELKALFDANKELYDDKGSNAELIIE